MYAVYHFSVHAELTRDNFGWIIDLPMKLAEQIFEQVTETDQGTIGGATRYTGYQMLNLVWLYLIATSIRRVRGVARTARAQSTVMESRIQPSGPMLLRA